MSTAGRTTTVGDDNSKDALSQQLSPVATQAVNDDNVQDDPEITHIVRTADAATTSSNPLATGATAAPPATTVTASSANGTAATAAVATPPAAPAASRSFTPTSSMISTPSAPSPCTTAATSSGTLGWSQRPSHTQPFGEYVASSMFLGDRSPIALVAASCATLYLTRSNPELLKRLACIFAILFPKHRRSILQRVNQRTERRRSQLQHQAAVAAASTPRSGSTTPRSRGHVDPTVGIGSLDPTTFTPNRRQAAPPATTLPPPPPPPQPISITNDNDTRIEEGMGERRAPPQRSASVILNASSHERPLDRLGRGSSSDTAGTGPPSVERTTSYQLSDETRSTTPAALASSANGGGLGGSGHHHFNTSGGMGAAAGSGSVNPSAISTPTWCPMRSHSHTVDDEEEHHHPATQRTGRGGEGNTTPPHVQPQKSQPTTRPSSPSHVSAGPPATPLVATSTTTPVQAAPPAVVVSAPLAPSTTAASVLPNNNNRDGSEHSSRSVSPTSVTSQSTIEPLFRQHTLDLEAQQQCVVDYFLAMVHRMVNLYFSYNWHQAQTVISVNKQYITYVEQQLIPRLLKWVRHHASAEVAAELTEAPPPFLKPGGGGGAAKDAEEAGVTPSEVLVGAKPRSPSTSPTAKNSAKKPSPSPSSSDVMMTNREESSATAEWLGGSSSESLFETSLDVFRATDLPPSPSAANLIVNAISSSSQQRGMFESSSSISLAAEGVGAGSTTAVHTATTSVTGFLDPRTVPFVPVTSESIVALCNQCEASDRSLVLFFHVPFSQPSCTMWDLLVELQRDWKRDDERLASITSSPTSPVIGLVYGVAELELVQAFDVTWYPTLVLVPRGDERCSRVRDLVCREVARREMAAVEAELVAATTPRALQASTCGGGEGHSDLRARTETMLLCDDDVMDELVEAHRSGSSVDPPTIKTPQAEVDEAANDIAQQQSRIAEAATLLEDLAIVAQQCPNHNTCDLVKSQIPQLPMLSSCSFACDADADDQNKGEGTIFYRFPEKGVVMKDAVREWIEGEGKVEARQRRFKAWITRLATLTAQLKFKPMRELHSACVMLRRLQGSATTSNGSGFLTFEDDGTIGYNAGPRAPPCTPEDPPMFIFLGGGMAAGKSTAATALTRSEWWESHKEHVVVVDADVFKMADPARESHPADLHEKSTKYAERLLVTALNQGRSVIFDGTMMWAPFVEQTVAMVRQAHEYMFAMGPGFDPKRGVEEYWQKTEKRKTPLQVPYRIVLLAITVEPQEAVPRGFMRTITTGRSVPIRGQLRSFRLFSKGFDGYAKLCDEVTLYNNNIRVDLDVGQLPPRILHKESLEHAVVVDDPHAYDMFLKHQNINDEATCCEEIFGGSMMMSSFPSTMSSSCIPSPTTTVPLPFPLPVSAVDLSAVAAAAAA